MKRIKLIAALASVCLVLAAAAGLGLSRAGIAYSQTSAPTLVVNTSGYTLPVYDGTTGLPATIGGEPWVIPPGGSFGSYPWGNQPRYVYGDVSFYYIGNDATGAYKFYLVEDWMANGGVLDAAADTTAPTVLRPVPAAQPAAAPANLPPLPLAVPTLGPPPTPTPVPTQAPPAAPVFGNYILSSVDYEPNCGLTAIKGRIVNPDGIGRDGVKVRVSTPDNSYSAISNFSDSQGYYDVTLASNAKAGTWVVQVWIFDGPQSAPVTVQTDTNDCRPNQVGRQVVRVDWRRIDTSRP